MSTPLSVDEIPLEHMQGNLLHNLVLFGRILRRLGVDINPDRIMEVTRALEHIEMWRQYDFYFTLRGLLINKPGDIPKFDEAYKLFWKKPEDGGIDLDLQDMLAREQMTSEQEIVIPPMPDEDEDVPEDDEDENGEEEEQEIIELTQTYSDMELLSQKDFAEMTPAELRAVKRLISQLMWQMGERKTRRQKPGRRGNIDFRRSLRRNFRYGGEMLEWKHREIKIKPRPLVVIADISGSMERYTRLLIHFLYSLSAGMDQRVDVFTFGTRLTRITRQLQHKDADQAIDDVLSAVKDWSGGTRIGDALQTFNFEWGRRVLRGGAIVIVISDGWDRGEPKLLGREMARLQRFSHRVVWLNPLLSSDRYEPLTRGLQACLPYIDDFLPVHNLDSLESLAEHLRVVDSKKRRKSQLMGAAFVNERR